MQLLVITPVRKIPLILKPKLEKELKRMVDLEIIEPVQKPTDWVKGLVEKLNGKLRVCIDPKPLNKAIKREHLHLPTAEEIFCQMSRASYFLKLDSSSGYWEIKVDKESSNLLAFGTPSGIRNISFQTLTIWNPFWKSRFSEESYFNYFGRTR